jgi:hypothetical protein
MLIEMIQSAGKLQIGYDAVPLEVWSVDAYFLPEAGAGQGKLTLIFEGGASYEVTATPQTFNGSGQYVIFSWEFGQADSFTVHYSIPVLQIYTWHISVSQEVSSIQIFQAPDDTVTYKLYADVTFYDVSADVTVQQGDAESPPLNAGENHVYLTTPLALMVVKNLTPKAEAGMLTIDLEVLPASSQDEGAS